MKKNKFKIAQEETINNYVDGIIKLITEQRDNLDNLIIKCEEIRSNTLKEINEL